MVFKNVKTRLSTIFHDANHSSFSTIFSKWPGPCRSYQYNERYHWLGGCSELNSLLSFPCSYKTGKKSWSYKKSFSDLSCTKDMCRRLHRTVILDYITTNKKNFIDIFKGNRICKMKVVDDKHDRNIRYMTFAVELRCFLEDWVFHCKEKTSQRLKKIKEISKSKCYLKTKTRQLLANFQKREK